MPPPLNLGGDDLAYEYNSPDFGQSQSPGSLGQSPSSASSGKNLNLNLNTLNNKIKAIKQRKKSKNSDEPATTPKQLDLVPDTLPQMSSDEEEDDSTNNAKKQ